MQCVLTFFTTGSGVEERGSIHYDFIAFVTLVVGDTVITFICKFGTGRDHFIYSSILNQKRIKDFFALERFLTCGIEERNPVKNNRMMRREFIACLPTLPVDQSVPVDTLQTESNLGIVGFSLQETCFPRQSCLNILQQKICLQTCLENSIISMIFLS